MKSLFVSVCENITILLFDLLQMTYFYHKITKTSEALLSRMNESLSRMNACLCEDRGQEEWQKQTELVAYTGEGGKGIS